MPRLHLGQLQESALEIYVFDPAFDDEPALCRVEGHTLVYDDADSEALASRLTDAANSADDGCGSPGNQPDLSEALARLVSRVRRRPENG